jgi:uncharacterized membrane protein
MTLFKLLHLLAVILWVGGMFLAYVVLRPAAVEILEPPYRLRLWDAVFRRFLGWVWGAVGVLLVSGFYLMYLYGGIANVSGSIHIMLTLGATMMVIFGYLFFACYVPFSLHVGKQRWKEAGEMLAKMRKIIAINLLLGILTICVAVMGPALSNL